MQIIRLSNPGTPQLGNPSAMPIDTCNAPAPGAFRNSAVCLSHGAAAWAIGTLAACSLATAGQCRDVRTADPSVDGRSRSLRDFNERLGTDGLIGGETICHRRTAIGSRHIVSPPPGRYVVLSVVNVYHHHHRMARPLREHSCFHGLPPRRTIVCMTVG